MMDSSQRRALLPVLQTLVSLFVSCSWCVARGEEGERNGVPTFQTRTLNRAFLSFVRSADPPLHLTCTCTCTVHESAECDGKEGRQAGTKVEPDQTTTITTRHSAAAVSGTTLRPFPPSSDGHLLTFSPSQQPRNSSPPRYYMDATILRGRNYFAKAVPWHYSSCVQDILGRKKCHTGLLLSQSHSQLLRPVSLTSPCRTQGLIAECMLDARSGPPASSDQTLRPNPQPSAWMHESETGPP
ncbi:hypothetical protein LZ30DRAFT_412282 [Colletotrichum cereale]|nr:hypothetical protein LZ30DRAFT_412282 [Colletotrichum cereale]